MADLPPNFSKLNQDTQFLIKSFNEQLRINTEKIFEKIGETDRIIEQLQSDVSLLQSTVEKHETNISDLWYEMDNIKFASNKEFLILSGPGVLQSNETLQKIIKATIQRKTTINIEESSITEATKITL